MDRSVRVGFEGGAEGEGQIGLIWWELIILLWIFFPFLMSPPFETVTDLSRAFSYKRERIVDRPPKLLLGYFPTFK